MSEDRFTGEKIILTDKEWRKHLSPEEYDVLRHKGTEPPFENAYFDVKKEGTYICAGCGLPLFSSEAKYDSGTGWPSFTEPVCEENVSYREDFSLRDPRVEVLCSRCEGHLGHVFEDGPSPKGKRFCMNSCALKLKESEDR